MRYDDFNNLSSNLFEKDSSIIYIFSVLIFYYSILTVYIWYTVYWDIWYKYISLMMIGGWLAAYLLKRVLIYFKTSNACLKIQLHLTKHALIYFSQMHL